MNGNIRTLYCNIVTLYHSAVHIFYKTRCYIIDIGELPRHLWPDSSKTICLCTALRDLPRPLSVSFLIFTSGKEFHKNPKKGRALWLLK